jgi:hypothetical protein
MPSGKVVDPPHSLKPTKECSLDQVLDPAALNYTVCHLAAKVCLFLAVEG